MSIMVMLMIMLNNDDDDDDDNKQLLDEVEHDIMNYENPTSFPGSFPYLKIGTRPWERG